eukprot:gene339-biopygen78
MGDVMKTASQNLQSYQEPPPAWATSMLQQLYKLEHAVSDIKLDILEKKSSIRLAYCRHLGMIDILVHNTDACTALLAMRRSMGSSSSMSMAEIVADYEVNNRGEGLVGPFGGNCQFAARAAEEFFSKIHGLMRAIMVTVVMYSPSGATLSLAPGINGTAPVKDRTVPDGAKSYRLTEGSCVWTQDDTQHPGPCKGYVHYVASVVTLDGHNIMVDWGIAQFAKLPSDMMMFV